MKKDIKDYYCEVTQEQANEAKELLLKYGEAIWEDEIAFRVDGNEVVLQFTGIGEWYVSSYDGLEATKVTYPEWKAILIEQYEQKPKIRKSELLERIEVLEKRVEELSKDEPCDINPIEQPRVVGGWYFFAHSLKHPEHGFSYCILEDVYQNEDFEYQTKLYRWKHCLTYEEVQELISKK